VEDFAFEPADFVPFRDKRVLERARSVHGKDLERYSNEKMKIRVTKNPHPIVIGDIFTRIKMSDDLDKKQVLILGNPEPETYIPVAELINYHRVNCRNLHVFAMDEWADQDGHIAPVSYPAGFAHSMLNYFVYQIDEELRMPLQQVHYPTNENISVYSRRRSRCLLFEPGMGRAYRVCRPRSGVSYLGHRGVPHLGCSGRDIAPPHHLSELIAWCIRAVRRHRECAPESRDDRSRGRGELP